VRVQMLPWTAAHEKLLTAYAGDSLPDIAQLGNSWIAEMAALDALEPLDERIAATPSVQPNDFFEGIWNTNVVDGRVMGVPWYVDTRILFYRRDLLAQAGFPQAPRSWDEWRASMRAIQSQAKAQNVAGGRHPLLLPTNEFEPLLALALQQDDPLLREQGRYGNFRSAGFQHALSFYAEIFRQGWAPQVTNNQISNVWDEIGRGRFVFYISGPWNIGEFKQRLPAAQQAGWMSAPLPGPQGPGASTAGGASLVIFRNSRVKPLAWKLIEFLSRPEQQLRLHALTGNLPPRRATWSAPQLANDVYSRAVREQLERAKPAPAVPEWERIVNEMQLVAARVAGAGLAVPDAAVEIDRRVDDFLAKRRWMLARRAAPKAA
jgi:multiple sugar transport system substrate-binding protein